MVAEELPVLAIFTVCVTVVWSAEVPKARLDGVAVSVALPGVCGTGVGVGEGDVGVGLPPLDDTSVPLPPQPININMPNVSVYRKRKSCCAVVCCFKGVAPAYCLCRSLLHGPWISVLPT